MKTLSNRARKRALTPWFNSDIFNEEKTQSRLFRQFVRTNNQEDYQVYKDFRKKLSKKKYRAKRKYFRALLSNSRKSNDKSATWEIINGILGRKQKTRVYPDQVESTNQTKSSDVKHIADALNNHFASVAEKLADKLPSTNTNHMAFQGGATC